MRKSPCTVTRAPDGGRLLVQPPHAELEGRPDLAEPVEEREGIAQRVASGQPWDARRGRSRWMAASARAALRRSARARAVAHSGSRRSLRGIVSPSSRSTTSQPGSSPSPAPAATTSGTGTPAPAAPPAAGPPRCAPGAGTDPVAALLLEDQRPADPVRGYEVERAGDAGGAAGEAPEIRHRAAEGPAELVGDLARSTRPLVDGDDRPPAVVELVEVLGDAVARCDRSRPRRRSVHRVRPSLTKVPAAPPDVGHPQDVAGQAVCPARPCRATSRWTTRWVSPSSASSVRIRHSRDAGRHARRRTPSPGGGRPRRCRGGCRRSGGPRRC